MQSNCSALAQLNRRQFGQIIAGGVSAQSLFALPAFAQGATDVVVGVSRNPASLEPCIEYSTQSWRVHFSIFDTLLRFDEADNFRLVPWLAKSWKRVDDRTVDFTLREGVTFHNGDTFTADDVAFTFGPERLSAEGSPGYPMTRATLGTITHVEALSPTVVRFVTTGPDPLLEMRVATFPAQIVCKRAYNEAASFDAWQAAPVGTGPYKVREFRAGDYVQLDAFKDYFAGAPNAATLKFQVAPEVSSRLAGLVSGQFQIITELTPDQFDMAKSAGGSVVGGKVANNRTIVYDTTNSVLQDVRIRRALTLSIDRDLITEQLWGSSIGVPNGNQWPGFGDLYFTDWPAYSFEPDEAAALVKEAGYDGTAIEYRITGTNYTFETQTAEVLVAMWKAVGLNVQLVFKENSQQILVPEGRGIRNWSNSMVYPDPLGGWWRLYGPYGPVQRANKEWANAEFNEQSNILETNLDPAARKAAWRRMMEIYHNDDPPGTVLHDFGMFYGLAKGIDWTPLPAEYMDFRKENLTIEG
ncbi:hypothetical protein G5B40_15120 [Pikeienuella piscinae]|uniref:Solute-binding protein family 5 domain-containing protein n=1 Tax=Pikeienuella piscinae TaxID=2748098 RepID=A0A7L5C287_9RHOB|nr:ABC transporter substrate-binding protein [Pikeienuella piscinae]QIE56646.1 hypothetical protein G5B40_15120 [Pikeienuella piscinae]